MIEEWKTIEGYEDYQVSNLGRVKSLKYKAEKILTPRQNKIKGGYLYVILCKDGETKSFQIHRLVARAFMPNPEDFILEINHIDRNPENNSLDNLEWCTRQKNVEHSSNKVVYQYGTSGNYIQSFESAKAAGEATNIDPSAISKVCLGKRKTAGGYVWKHSSEGHADDQYNKICDKLAQEASKTIEITN